MIQTLRHGDLARYGVFIDGGPVVAGDLVRGYESVTVATRVGTLPDLGWQHVDRAGHFHAFTVGGDLPTLNRAERRLPCEQTDDPDHGDRCEGTSELVWQCRICGEQVEPRRVPDNNTREVQGAPYWYVTVTADRAFKGLVSVRIADAGRILFGVASGRVLSSASSRNGVAVTSRLHGVGPLGVRPTASGGRA